MPFLLFVVSCFSGMRDPELDDPSLYEVTEIPQSHLVFAHFPVEICVELEGEGPWPTRVVTLWQLVDGGTAAQHELSGGEGSAVRCAKDTLNLPVDQEDIRLSVRYMPSPLDRRAKELRLRAQQSTEPALEVQSSDGREFFLVLSTKESDLASMIVLLPGTLPH